MATVKGSIHAYIEHPSYREKQDGEVSHVTIVVDRKLKSGKLDFVEIDLKDALRLIESLSAYVCILIGDS
jgi:hypothetical protein